MNIKEQHAAAVKIAQDIIDTVKSEGRSLTPGEKKKSRNALDEAHELEAKMERAAEGEALLKSFSTFTPAQEIIMNGAVGSFGDGYLGLSGPASKALSIQVAQTMHNPNGSKGVTAVGSSLTEIPILPNDPVSMGRVAQSFLELIPAETSATPAWKFLRQTVRTNSAAPVAAGAVKPTSVYTWGHVDAALHVIAHLSEPIDKFMLEDASALESWVSGELLYGIRVAVENQVLNGSGTAPALRGLLNTSGILVQAFVTNVLTTTRKAITALEVSGQTPGAFVVSPTDWELLELSSATVGSTDFNGLPVDRATQRLWGVPVAISTVLPEATGFLLDLSSLKLRTDTSGVKVAWSENVSDDFTKNQVRARCEGRFELEVRQPMGVVKLATAAA